jgi:hypothetical protein
MMIDTPLLRRLRMPDSLAMPHRALLRSFAAGKGALFGRTVMALRNVFEKMPAKLRRRS